MSTKKALIGFLNNLYASSPSADTDGYLQWQSGHNAVRRHVEAFLRYEPYLPSTGRILDWGCHYAPDACLIRHRFGKDIELHGCDFGTIEMRRFFHESASLRFSELTHLYKLPYEDEHFDAVIGSGVLEHTAMDLESLKELHRLLKTDGVLVLTFLPNRLSCTEWCSRRLGLSHHRRRYSRREIRELLLHYGFAPLLARYHQFIPAGRWQAHFRHLYWLNGVLESMWPTRMFCTNIMVVARKCTVM